MSPTDSPLTGCTQSRKKAMDFAMPMAVGHIAIPAAYLRSFSHADRLQIQYTASSYLEQYQQWNSGFKTGKSYLPNVLCQLNKQPWLKADSQPRSQRSTLTKSRISYDRNPRAFMQSILPLRLSHSPQTAVTCAAMAFNCHWLNPMCCQGAAFLQHNLGQAFKLRRQFRCQS